MSSGLDRETLDLILGSIEEFAHRELPESVLLELDERDEFPADVVHKMCSSELGIQLLFIAEEYGGMGGATFDIYRVCERMAAHRPRRRHRGARHVPRQRPDHRRRHARAEEARG